MTPRQLKRPRALTLSKERGTILKDWGGRLPIALVYPGPYYTGMSSLGLQVVYALLNEHTHIVAERFFWEGDPQALVSLESGRPLGDFPLIAFSISYELSYLELPAILRAGNVPLFSLERRDGDPVVIAGGPAPSANPMPVAPLLDAVGIGEAEALLPPIIPLLTQASSRQARLEAFSSQEGFYVTQYPTTHPVPRQWVKDLDSFPAHSVVVSPDTELGNLYLIEAERGCGGGCLFCMVRTAFHPMRFRQAQSVLEQAAEGTKYRKRIGLVGPAISDHPQIEEILSGIIDMGAGISVSSLRAETISPEMLRLLAIGGSKSLVLAPEAGSVRLRRLIGKHVSDDKILETASSAAELGFKRLKLYFMLGLHTETDDDVDAITTLALRCREATSGRLRLTLNLTPFVPKAHTPFQWQAMADSKVLKRRLKMVQAGLARYGIEIRSESPAWSRVQGVLSRGDSSLAPLIASLPDTSLASWRKIASEQKLEERFLEAWPLDRPLPWAVVDLGVRQPPARHAPARPPLVCGE